MVFSNPFFLYIFLPLVLLFYFISKNDTYRRTVLLVFSLIFYACGEPKCVFLMIALVFVDYAAGLLIGCTYSKVLKRLCLILALIVNLGFLCYFKYLGFFAETANYIFGTSIYVLSIVMPIGISFFTFQAISYVIDVYREDTNPQGSFFKLLLYVSFFPQLIAGPIVRYKDIDRQLNHRNITPASFNEGLFRFAVGLAKKVLIADCCQTVITSLYSLNDVTVAARWVGAVFFTLQLYFDFSGYSDMAIGLARMFGFRLLENFDYPLVSSSVTEFWRRWHISLGTFFRDYVYIPLGGNRKRHIFNLIIVWFLTGLWHGASWNFVLWGLYYGFLLIIEKKFLLKLFDKMAKPVSFVLSHLYTVFITVFGFAIFYFDKDLLRNIGYLFGQGTSSFTDIYTNSIIMNNILLLAAAVILSAPVFPVIWNKLKEKRVLSYDMNRVIKTVVTVSLIALATVRLAGNSYSPFLYFRF